MKLASSTIPALQRVNRTIAIPGRRRLGQLANRLHLLAYRLRIYLAETLPRLFDINCAASAILLLAPLLLVRALLARVQYGRVFDRYPMHGRNAARFDSLEFAGHYPGRSLAVLFNILKGDLSLTGPRARTPEEAAQDSGAEMAVRHAVRPGMISPFSMRRRVGIAHDAEAETDSEFVYTQTAGGSVTLLLRALLGRLITGAAERPAPDTLRFFAVDMANTTMDETLAWLTGRARERERTLLAFVNPDCLNTAYVNPDYLRVLQQASRVLPDGIGVNVGCRIKGVAMRANLNGTDLFPRLCETLAATGQSIYLLGAQPGRAAATAQAMQEKFPQLRVAGTRHGYFDAAEDAAVIQDINASGADILLVAMGAPRQELWLAQHQDALTVPVRMGVGGLFDYYSGSIPRAPLWLREIGLEWVWRLLQEPGRMWKRYLIGNPLYLYRVWRECRGERKASRLARQPRSLPGNRFSRMHNRISAASRRSLWRHAAHVTDVMKRLIDVAVSGTLLVLLLPLFGLVALAIRLESPGSVFFRQVRVGCQGRTFAMWKFRSMYIDAEQRKVALEVLNEMQGGVIFKLKQDPRITRVGRIIRRLSIDELPQLWNVFKGDMSLVGPRPALPTEVSQYSLDDRGRLDAKPGITCTWQVTGRSDIPFNEQVLLDIEYINQQSVRNDLKLLVKTVPAVISGRGAY
jgi:exopolysaccharide biosynthesis WecB/TagA/CpsF family protein